MAKPDTTFAQPTQEPELAESHEQPRMSDSELRKSLERFRWNKRFIFENADKEKDRAMHPVIAAMQRDGVLYTEEFPQLRSSDSVLLKTGGSKEPQWFTFDKYLEMLGATYIAYHQLLRSAQEKKEQQDDHSPIDQRELLMETHRFSVDRRTFDVIKLRPEYEKEEANKDNMQSETRAQSIIFNKLFDDLQIPGLGSINGRRRNDYKDTIDDFILLNPEALITGEDDEDQEGEEPEQSDRFLHIGVQRTFGPLSGKTESVEKDLAKQQIIREHPVYWIPERLGWGPVVRVYTREKLSDYDIDPDNPSHPDYLDRLHELRQKEVERLKAQGQKKVDPNTIPLKSLDKVMGHERQHIWSRKVLSAVKKEIEAYIQREELEAYREIFERYLKAIDLAQNRISSQLEHYRSRKKIA